MAGLVVMVLVAVGMFSPAAAVSTQVAVTRVSGPPVSGVPLSLVVKVANGLIGQKVWLEHKVGRTWSAVAKRMLPGSRTVTLGSPLRLGSQYYRVHVFAKGTRTAAFRSVTLLVGPRVNPAPYVGEAFSLSGRLPLNGVRSVRLQRRSGSSWLTVSTKATTSAGTVAFARPGTSTAEAYRFFAPTTGAAKAFTSKAVGVTPAQRTSLVSRTPAGLHGNDQSAVSDLSGNGRYVAFSSLASDLGPQDTNPGADIYLRDLVTGTTRLVTRSVGGGPANGANGRAAVSADGRYVAFVSNATNLVSPSSAGTVDVFRYDRVTGATKLISRSPGGGPANGSSDSALSISADGSRIAFASDATNFELGFPDQNGSRDVYLWRGSDDTISRVSKPLDAGSGGGGGVSGYSGPQISADGLWVGFVSDADDIVTGSSTAAPDNVYLRNVAAQSTALVTNTPCAGGGAISYAFGVSNGGWRVGYDSSCSDIVGGDSVGTQDTFVRDMGGGFSVLVNRSLAIGFSNDASLGGEMSATGKYVVFESAASDLVEGDLNGKNDVFRWTIGTGTLSLISQRPDHATANGNSSMPSVSDSGQFVSWTSVATDLAAGDTNPAQDVYVRDLR